MTDMKKPAQWRANPNHSSGQAHEHYSPAVAPETMKNGLLSPGVNAIVRDYGDHVNGKHFRPAMESRHGRRNVRRMLEKQGHSKARVQQMLIAMGYGDGRAKG